MPWPALHPVSHLDRAVLGDQQDGPCAAREPGGALKVPLSLASSRERSNSPQQLVSVDKGPGATGPGPVGRAAPADSSRRVHVLDAEDDGHAVRGPEAGLDQPDDAVDDAYIVRLFHASVFQRPGHLLGGLQYRWYDHSGVRHWLEPHYRYVKVRKLRYGIRGRIERAARSRLGDLD